jgi:peptidoglycan/LPS O-acetylase OafA/YrhL
LNGAPPSPGRYYALDGMRGFAAITVMLLHFGLQVNIRIAASGYLAVDFFFALSGFVVALAYRQRLEAGLSVRRFMAIRLVRLYPLFLIGIGFGIVKAIGQIAVHDDTALSPPVLLLSLVSSVLMLPTPAPGLVSIFPLNTPAWSLFFEMLLSAAFALGLYRWKPSSIALLLLITGAFLVQGILSRGYTGPLGSGWADFGYGFPRVLFSFLVGMSLHRLSLGRERRVTGDIHIAMIALIALLIAHPGAGIGPGYDIFVLGLAFPALLWAGILLEVPHEHRRFFAWLGDISYPLYILHFPLLMMWLYVAERFHIPVAVSGICFVLGMLALSTLVLRLYDEPVRRMLSITLGLPGSCRWRRPVAHEAASDSASKARPTHKRNPH